MAVDFSALEKKWLSRWQDSKAFEANPDKRPKFFVNFPYPYMNSLMHIGHFYTIMRVEALARYKRMRGFNVLFPQGWHCTGSPIENAAQRIREGEPKQMEIMAQLGIPEEKINEFADPKKWAEYFPKEAEKDLRLLGLSIDWRRSFITTSLNPYYDKFIRWQFGKLKDKGYVVKGKHPVVWCTKDNSPVPDHSRVEGEGETPQDFIWVKFRLIDSGLIMMAGTTRPDALYGQTNVWVDPKGEYVVVQVGAEKWIVGRKAVEKIENQYPEAGKVKVIRDIKPQEIIGKWAQGPLVERKAIVLPADFIDAGVGSGIVYSALEDPVDLYELRKIQSSEKLMEIFGPDREFVRKLVPIDIISVPGMGKNLGEQIGKEFGVKSEKDVEKLAEAKGELNKRVFRKGVMLDNCGKCAGLAVPAAQAVLKKELQESGDAVMFYELTGKVVCRCLTESVVKIVSDQWFIKYSDGKWKGQCRKALGELRLYPETARQQFEYVVGWLNDWPCTREFGLGTSLPWDGKWVIESLSDSTIYMAFYTIAHKIREIPAEKINDLFFDYVLLGKVPGGKGAGANGEGSGLLVDKKICDGLRAEFEYWYPVDFRNSGKDLIQNHLTFFIFNHVAIWDDSSKHPKGIGTNGWITVNGEKMSKSKGNFILLRELPEKFGCDASRFAVLCGGEGLDDANFESGLAESMNAKFSEWLGQSPALIASGVDVPKQREIDLWFGSELNRIILETTGHMDEAMFKSALKSSFFELQRVIKWYIFRTAGRPEKALILQAVISQILLLAPVAPFVAEELWEKTGGKGMVCGAKWPPFDASKISKSSQESERLVQQTLDDVRHIRELAKIEKPKKVSVFTAPEWKWKAIGIAAQACREKPDFGAVMKALMQDAAVRGHGKEVEGFAKQAVKVAKEFLGRAKVDEGALLLENASFFSRELDCEFVVMGADSATANKERSHKAFPLKPAILVE